MFNKLKQFKDLRDQAKEMQSVLADEKITVSHGGVEMTLDGNLKLIHISVDEVLLSKEKKTKLESAIKETHAEGMKKIQRIMAMKMKDMGGLPNIPGLS